MSPIKKSRSVSRSRSLVNIEHLASSFERFVIIQNSDWSQSTTPSIIELENDINDVAYEENNDENVAPTSIVKQPNTSLIKQPSVPFAVDCLSILDRTSKPEPQLESLISNLSISGSSSRSPAFVVKKKITIRDYDRFSTDLKFKICLNFIRLHIFKEIVPFTSIPQTEDLIKLNRMENIKNVLFYQIFKRFEQYYAINNSLIQTLNVSNEHKLKLIESVEKVYLNSWNLNDYVALEQRLFTDLY